MATKIETCHRHGQRIAYRPFEQRPEEPQVDDAFDGDLFWLLLAACVPSLIIWGAVIWAVVKWWG